MDQTENSLVLRQKEHATALTAILTNADTAREFERGLTINKIVSSAFPITEVIREVGFKAVAQTIDIALTKLVKSVNVGNNINDAQIKTIVEDLIAKYPHESVEDFILVFKKARTGEFGTIYNLHSAVIFGWMDQYLEQKYEEVQRQNDNLKQAEKSEALNPQGDWLKLWKESIELTDKEGGVKTQSQNLTILSNLRGLTDKETREQGQEKPKYEPHINGIDQNLILLKERIKIYANEKYKDVYSFTGFSTFKFGLVEVFAKSLEDAKEILQKSEL